MAESAIYFHEWPPMITWNGRERGRATWMMGWLCGERNARKSNIRTDQPPTGIYHHPCHKLIIPHFFLLLTLPRPSIHPLRVSLYSTDPSIPISLCNRHKFVRISISTCSVSRRNRTKSNVTNKKNREFQFISKRALRRIDE